MKSHVLLVRLRNRLRFLHDDIGTFTRSEALFTETDKERISYEITCLTYQLDKITCDEPSEAQHA